MACVERMAEQAALAGPGARVAKAGAVPTPLKPCSSANAALAMAHKAGRAGRGASVARVAMVVTVEPSPCLPTRKMSLLSPACWPLI